MLNCEKHKIGDHKIKVSHFSLKVISCKLWELPRSIAFKLQL